MFLHIYYSMTIYLFLNEALSDSIIFDYIIKICTLIASHIITINWIFIVF